MKLIGHTYDCSSLTNFEYEVNEMTGNRSYVNLLKLGRKNSWNHFKQTERSPKNSVSSERKTGGGHWQGEIFAAVSRAKGAIYANYLFSHKPWNTERKKKAKNCY